MPDSARAMRDAADRLLIRDADPGARLDAARDLYDALVDLSGWDASAEGALDEIALDAGVALSPRDAARCVLEPQRTTAFLRGALAAIGAAADRDDGPVEVLYAGCGPFAPLAVALCHLSPRARFWPVDIHPGNVASVSRLIARAGLGDRFGDVALADAARHRWPVAGHVGVVEVMQRGLEKEPQVAVAANVASQLRPGGALVPARVALEVQLADVGAEFDLDASGGGRERIRVPLTPLLSLDAVSAAGLAAGRAVEFDYAEPAGLHVMVTTRIETGAGPALGDYDCSLTVPWIAHALGRSGPGRRGRIRLVPGPPPRLEAEPLCGYPVEDTVVTTPRRPGGPVTDAPRIDLAELTLDAARALVGREYRCGDVALRLDAAEALPRDPSAPGAPDRPFGLVFRGSAETPLAQGMRDLDHPDGGFAGIFLVPVSETGGVRVYQAVFS